MDDIKAAFGAVLSPAPKPRRASAAALSRMDHGDVTGAEVVHLSTGSLHPVG